MLKHKIFYLILFLILCSTCQSIISQDYPVEIIFSVDDKTFPEIWKNSEINASGESLDIQEYSRSLNVLKIALNKYPKNVINQNLKKIYVLKIMKFYDQFFGGTNASDVVYITNDGVLNGYTDNYIEKTFHHEFSSILLRNFPDYFDTYKWKSFNKLNYGTGGVQALKNGKDGQIFNDYFNENGFLYEYGVSDIENDFNSFAENLFLPDSIFWNKAKKYNCLDQKIKIVINFYSHIDKAFNLEYFKKFEISK